MSFQSVHRSTLETFQNEDTWTALERGIAFQSPRLVGAFLARAASRWPTAQHRKGNSLPTKKGYFLTPCQEPQGSYPT